jgi:hypothetical protein
LTEEQIQYLKDNNIAYSPSIFKYCKCSFPKYLGIMRLAAYRVFGWEDSAFVEEGAKDWVERIVNND